MNNFDNEFEKAVRQITDAMPLAEELEKPTLLHSIRVGIYLYNNQYSREVCIAGLLHDAIEDTKITKEDIENNFGKEIAEIVQANTKDENLTDNKYKDMMIKCIEYGEDALIVKAADIIDNFNYYTRINEHEGLAYVHHITSLLLELKPEDFKDPIFDYLKSLK